MGPRAGAIVMSAAMAAAFGVAACGPTVKTPEPPPPPLAQQLRDDMAARGAIAWSADRRLQWSDYQGSAPPGGDEGALTAYSIFYGVRCTGEAFDFLAAAGFLPHESWVRPTVVADPDESEKTLRHERTHFDLTEVFTRRLRKSFSDLYQPCRRQTSDLDSLATQYIREEKAEQLRYDEETRHGLATAAQAGWDRQVASDLTALAAYGGK